MSVQQEKQYLAGLIREREAKIARGESPADVDAELKRVRGASESPRKRAQKRPARAAQTQTRKG